MNEKTRWWKEGVIYQIYPRSFKDTNQDGIGDLRGIIDKLDYLQELGVDAVWMSPIFPSPDVDFGYDVSDYRSIDSKFGSMQDFDLLIDTAHSKGIHIILDLVLNHTSNQHPWFLQSRSSVENAYRDWYIWQRGRKGKHPPNNWQSFFGGSGWQHDPQTNQFYFHMFSKEQPDLNWRNPRVRAEMLNIFRYWCDKGVDGFRLDVFNAYFKHRDFPSNPLKLGLRGFDRQEHLYDVDQPEMIPLLNEIRRILDTYEARYAVGETFLESSGRAEMYCSETLLHGAFNFNLAQAPWNAKKMKDVMTAWELSLPEETWPTQVLNNHDLSRSATRFGRGENDERLKIAAGLLLTLRGTPFLYYGEEIGMRDIKLKRREILDPVGKRYWPFYKGRDGCRSPMQWDPSEQGGFTSARPWLPVHNNYTHRNVAAQEHNPESLLNFYKTLLRIRRRHSALRNGTFVPIPVGSERALTYLRENQDETVWIVCNFDRRKINLTPGLQLGSKQWKFLISNQRGNFLGDFQNTITLKPEEILILWHPASNQTPGGSG